jgi:hypothetical protein
VWPDGRQGHYQLAIASHSFGATAARQTVPATIEMTNHRSDGGWRLGREPAMDTSFIECIDENGGGPGVRLRKRSKDGSRR